jgi:hypothetical protein
MNGRNCLPGPGEHLVWERRKSSLKGLQKKQQVYRRRMQKKMGFHSKQTIFYYKYFLFKDIDQ